MLGLFFNIIVTACICRAIELAVNFNESTDVADFLAPALAVMGVANRGLSPITALFLILVAVDFFLPLRAFGSAFHIAMNGAS